MNSDVPRLVDLWNRQDTADGRLQNVTAAMLETHVFSKSYFDPAGLILAATDRALAGAVFCGFAPNQDGSELNPRIGVLSHLIVDDAAPTETWAKLWESVQAYFRRPQAEVIFYGSRFPDSPFLVGFCGGTFVPGVTTTDQTRLERLSHAGFQACGEVDVFKIDVERFKPPVDRRVVMAKRSYDVRLAIDPPPESWWQNNVSAFRHQLDYRMIERKSNRNCGFLSFCNSRPQDSGWDSRHFGIARIQVDEVLQRSGLGQAMMFDAIKDLGQRGVVEIEAQVPRANTACRSMLKKIGFQNCYAALQMRNDLSHA